VNLALSARQEAAYRDAGEASFEDTVVLMPRIDGSASQELYGAWERDWGNGAEVRAMIALAGQAGQAMTESPELAETPGCSGVVIFPVDTKDRLSGVDRVRWIRHGHEELPKPLTFKLIGEPLMRMLGLVWGIELAPDGVPA